MKDAITKLLRGLFKDSSYQDQPEGTHSFALNAVNETDQGDDNTLSNEESNEICATLPKGYIPIGKVYMTNNRMAIISVSEDNTTSEIGIYYPDSCEYKTHVNDATSIPKDKLRFSKLHQIQVTYRLRLGCEDTIYWTDNNKRPRYFNFQKPENFKNSNDEWVSSKFNLQKTYNKIPEFEEVSIIESGGNLKPGAYSFSIQYVDSSLNPTEWITSTPSVKIYNSSLSDEYSQIIGSISSDVDYLDFPPTSKAIKLKVGNLDPDFAYYRFAIICSNNGSGLVNEVYYTDTIPISKDFFIYTGENHLVKGTEEEIMQFATIIEKAGSIEQIENRLILANTEGTKSDLCKLQKYASKIMVDGILKEVNLTDINDKANTKNPVHEFNDGLGYMPGEIYSLGIVYIFEDNSLSPVYHIPGKAYTDSGVIFSPVYDDNGNLLTFPMKCEDDPTHTLINQSSNFYDSEPICSNPEGYWGRDYNGNTLGGKHVRHHRFPLRSEINQPLITNEYEQEQTNKSYYIQLTVSGDILTYAPCPEGNPTCGTDVPRPPFTIKVEYEINGEAFSFTLVIDPAFYADGINGDINISEFHNSPIHDSSSINVTGIYVTDLSGVYQDTTSFDFSVYFDGSPTITTTVEEYTSVTQGKQVKSKIFGLRFSNIEKPSIQDTNGLEVIGYYIVRNERTEFEKTVLDSGVLTPVMKHSKYLSQGLLQPQGYFLPNDLSPDAFGLIHPEHKFNGKEYLEYDKLIKEGNYKRKLNKYGKINYDDVYPGSTYNEENHKDSKNDDGKPVDGSPVTDGYDGWSFNLISRDTIVEYNYGDVFEIPTLDIDQKFYLDALESKSIKDYKNEIYNLACDNKTGIITLKDKSLSLNLINLPYVIIYKHNTNSYSNFRVLPYYKETINPIYFTGNLSVKNIFSGDSYISPMRYTNTLYYENRAALRQNKRSVWKIIVGSILTIAGLVLAFWTGGSSLALSAFGAGMIASGLKTESYNKAYGEEYERGLKNTTLDDWVKNFYGYKIGIYNVPSDGTFGFTGSGTSGKDGPSDDTIEWISDTITDLWFESAVNINLRNRYKDDIIPSFLHSPWKIEAGNNTILHTRKLGSSDYIDSNAQRYPMSSIERHGARKLLAFDSKRNDNRYYLGAAIGEYYHVNPDYMRRNKQKVFFHLPKEFDCCSDCMEQFPHRVHYSEQSFQEEISDNFRVFLPNNYRDIEGETGVITNVIRFNNDLLIHTEEALWQLPRNYQERITDQIVSFIGTGSYFEIPPQKLIDDESGMSAGCIHKWATLKTPQGVFFPSENMSKIYQFNGQLKPISDSGLEKWFKEHLKSKMNLEFYKQNRKPYPFRNNPSNPIGTGIISTLDTKKNRIIFTKKDKIIDVFIDTNDGDFCYDGLNLTIFENVAQIISQKVYEGWIYTGIENCELQFERQIVNREEIIRYVWTEVEGKLNYEEEVIIIPYFDEALSLNEIQRLSVTIQDHWFIDFKNSVNGGANGLTLVNPSYGGIGWNIYFDGAYIKTPFENILTNIGVNKKIVVFLFSYNNFKYHQGHLTETNFANYLPMFQYNTNYHNDLNNFIYNIYPQFDKLKVIHYPLLNPDISLPLFPSGEVTVESLQHSIAAITGGILSTAEASNIEMPNTIYFTEFYESIVRNTIENNTYQNLPALKDYGWFYTASGFDMGMLNGINGTTKCPPEIPYSFPPCVFDEDSELYVENIFTGSTTWGLEEVTQIINTVTTEYLSIPGTAIRIDSLESIDNSWTLSYSLKKESWTSWHSYIPNMYFHIPDDFFAWIYGNDNLWKFNKLGHYQTYFGKHYPFVVEFVSVSNPIVTRIWDYIKLITEAKKYNITYEEFVDERFVTFNKAIFYNSRQNSGVLNLLVKDVQPNDADYLMQQVENLQGDTIIIDRNERDWHINQLRDVVIDYTIPMFIKKVDDLQNDYYIDKIVNPLAIDYDKDWTQLEKFRDKYLVIRLIFDTFADVKLLFNYTVENENQSFR